MSFLTISSVHCIFFVSEDGNYSFRSQLDGSLTIHTIFHKYLRWSESITRRKNPADSFFEIYLRFLVQFSSILKVLQLHIFRKFQRIFLISLVSNTFRLYFSIKPTLKKVSKYENKFAKLQKKAAEFNFRNQLKVVKKKEFTLEEEDKEVRK